MFVISKKILTLSIFFVFVFSFVYAEENIYTETTVDSGQSNPVFDFVGQDTGIDLNQEVEQINTMQQESESAGFFERIRGFFSKLFTNPLSLFTSENEEDGLISEIKCHPKDTLAGEPFIVLYRCSRNMNGLPTTLLINYKDDSQPKEITMHDVSAGIGKYIVDEVTAVSSVSLICGKTTTSCDVNQFEPEVYLSVTNQEVENGGTTDISWRASSVTNCTLVSDQDSTWKKTGTSGQAITHAIHKDTTFTLTCQTKSIPVKEQITVKVK